MRDAFHNSSKADTPLSVAFADLDKFKSVNDTYGHAIGDQILVTTANILKANVRGADVDGRQFRSADELLKAADKALYTAKLQGRNRSVPFELVAGSQLAQV